MKKYDDKRVFMEGFSCAPPEPYYRIGPEAFLRNAAAHLQKLVLVNSFASSAEEIFVKDLERHYSRCLKWFERATSCVDTVH
ncbi:MAG: hypothetical protein U0V75_00170 [Ferruginibacter sp.]